MKICSTFSLVAASTALLANAMFLHSALAQTFPSKPIRIVVPYATGGFTDIVLRLAARQMTDRLGQPVVVEHRAGAGTIIGAEYVAKPGAMNVATLGAGGSSQFVGAMFSSVSGIKMTEVSYKGAGPALTDLLAGVQAPVMRPKQFGHLIEEHTKVWGNIIKPLNIQLG
jgi:tripartite-type tricarboxylate transporter receptor subunit TctC